MFSMNKKVTLAIAILVGTLLIAVAWCQRHTHRVNKLAGVCLIQVKTLDFAKRTWASVNGKTTNDPAPTIEDLRPFVGRGVQERPPECPCGGVYTPGRLDQPATCSLSVEEHTYRRNAAHERLKP